MGQLIALVQPDPGEMFLFSLDTSPGFPICDDLDMSDAVVVADVE